MGGYKQIGDKPLRDYKNRKRYITIGFRVSPEQRDELYKRIKLTGRTIQDYMLQSGLQQQIIVVGNPQLRERIIAELQQIVPLLKRIENNENIDPVVMAELRTIFEITEVWE